MSERNAWRCDHPDHVKENVFPRKFLGPNDPIPPTCDDHPNRKMARQKNEAYMVGRNKRVAPAKKADDD